MSRQALPGIRVADVAWADIETRLRQGAIAVLPIGAGAKEHGLHLPMATDQLQVEWLVDRLVESREVVAWPTLTYGFYPAFVDYPGSISLSRETFVAAVAEILQGIARAGATRIAIVNTGISTIRPIAESLLCLPHASSTRQINVYSGAHLARVASLIIAQPWGGHADELETAIMLAIAPGMVDMRRAEPAVYRIEQGPFNRTNPHAPNYSPTGVNGDPTLATRDKGERLLEAMLKDVLTAIDTLDADGQPGNR